MSEFAHLHLHTVYSFLDGMVRPRDLGARCAELGISACAITDHRHVGGTIAGYRALRDAGVKPILGMEASTKDHGHLIVLARTKDGYDNLRELATRQQAGDLESADLLAHRRGLVFTTACVANRVAAACARGHMDEAQRALTRLIETVNPGRVFLELQPTSGPHLRANARLQELADDHQLKCVVTNDVHYLRPEDHDAQNVLMAIRQGARLGDRGVHQHPAPAYYLRSGDEMLASALTHGIDLRHLDTTLELAADCSVELDLGTPDLPPFSDDDARSLADRALAGLRARGLDARPAYRRRLDTELEVINDKGFPGYFLIVQDFVAWARDHGCAVGPGRGSGAGSLVAYALGITDLDPIEHKLFFERFLNPERESMPDFDIDFMRDGRGSVIDYVVGRWGREHVGQIATYMSLHPKSAIKDVARAMDMPFARVNELTKPIPQILKPGNDEEAGLSEFDLALVFAPELRELAQADEEWAQLLSVARQLTGCMRQTGKHAGGVVIGRLPLTAYTALTDDGRTQLDMVDVEAAGLVKFDFLGLKTLDIIDAAARHAGVDARDLPLDDEDVYADIARGDTWGLFQVESQGMTTMCRELRPDRFDDIVAAVALYRPGPMDSGMLAAYINRKHGREAVEYPHPALATILADTYGTFVYQEQVMQAAQALAGYSLGGADLLRRAMGKKKPAEMAKQRGVWMEGCSKKGIDEDLAGELFDAIEKFAGYGFNRSHAAAYALITYQTAWLKHHHPLSFTAALLTVEGGDQERLARYVRAARGAGIRILGPDVNASGAGFRVEDRAVRWGLGAIKGVGASQLPGLVAGAPYTDLGDLASRSGLGSGTMRSLIDAGACDGFGVHRGRMDASLATASRLGRSQTRARRAGQTSMFEFMGFEYADAEPRPDDLAREYRALGAYVSGHPTTGVGGPTPSTYHGGNEVTGAIVDVFTKRSKKHGRMWAKITIEDARRAMTLLAFPDDYERVRERLRTGTMARFVGYRNKSGEFVVGDCLEPHHLS